jgi:hypothetical protein
MALFNLLRHAPMVASRQLRPSIIPVFSQMAASASSPLFLGSVHNLQQVRTIKMTKRKRHILAKKKKWAELAAQGIFPPNPPNFIDPNTPVMGAKSREDRNADAKAADDRASLELKERMTAAPAEPLLRFHMEGLTMTDRVRKLFDLTNGNQSEVVKAQKLRGMELFQLRDGDTGSSAVQGEFSLV